MSVVDQFSDPAFGLLFRQVNRMPKLENFVKEASVESSEAQSLPDQAYAWPDERKFPIHTPHHAALSYAYFKAASEQMPPYVEANLKKALDVYQVPAEVFTESEVKVAEELSDADYLIPDMKLFPIKTAAQVKRAQAQLVDHLQRLDLEHRATACANLVKKAQEFSVELHPEVQKLAGFVVSSTRQVRDWLEARAHVAEQPVHKLAYQTMADELSKQPQWSKDRDGLLKLASVIGQLDERSGLDRHYDRKIPDALRTVFNTKTAASGMVELGGKLVSVAKLASLPASFWSDLDPDIGRELAPNGVVDQSKLATVVDTLPLDLKNVVAAYVR
jgi:hypothetical protein